MIENLAADTNYAICQKIKPCDGGIRRSIYVEKKVFESEIQTNETISEATASNQWNLLRLKGSKPISIAKSFGDIGVLDLFSGCGGFSLGASEAIEALGFTPLNYLAVDLDKDALQVFKANLRPKEIICNSVTSLVNFQLCTENGSVCFAGKPSLSPHLHSLKGKVDLVIGGPPCQGHSGFNNRTRGDDPRNRLYYTVAATGIAIDASLIVIENVPRIVKDKDRVVEKTKAILKACGYYSEEIVCMASDYGVAQNRERHFLVASKHSVPQVHDAKNGLKVGSLGAYEAIHDLEIVEGNGIFNSFSVLNEDNKARVDFLFENNLYELPNHVRPDCHKDGHSYPSVYGRLRPDKPANTLTTGFMSPGRGRYIHPTLRRCLTPHEAARLQGFPDTFNFNCRAIKEINFSFLSKVIGDAVPPPLGFVPIISALATLPFFSLNDEQ